MMCCTTDAPSLKSPFPRRSMRQLPPVYFATIENSSKTTLYHVVPRCVCGQRHLLLTLSTSIATARIPSETLARDFTMRPASFLILALAAGFAAAWSKEGVFFKADHHGLTLTFRPRDLSIEGRTRKDRRTGSHLLWYVFTPITGYSTDRSRLPRRHRSVSNPRRTHESL